MSLRPIRRSVELEYEDKQFTYDDIISEEGLLLIAAWTRDGLTQNAIFNRLGITQQTWYNWRRKSEKRQDDPIGTALRKGKEIIDYQVENALLKAALGYKTVTVKTVMGPPNKNGNREVRVERTESEIGPNTTACLAWLNNRKPDAWRRNRDSVLEYEDRKNGITINIVKGQPVQQEDEDDEEGWDDDE